MNSKIKPTDEKGIIELFEKAILNEDPELVEEGVILLCTLDSSNEKYLKYFHELLKLKWHYKHEDIVDLIGDLSNVDSIDYLFDVAQLRLKYLDYDDTYQLARKAIKGLCRIESTKALERLKTLASDANPVIAAYATKEMLRAQ